MSHFKRLRGDNYTDTIVLQTVPRYKMSDLSGNEWRTGVRVVFLRKGRIVWERTVGDMPAATAMLGGFWIEASETIVGAPDDDTYCFQPGCSEKAVSEYRLKQTFCNEGHGADNRFDYRRRFCKRHLRRGDCALEDADKNYDLVSGPGPSDAEGWLDDASPSSLIVVDGADWPEAGVGGGAGGG